MDMRLNNTIFELIGNFQFDEAINLVETYIAEIETEYKLCTRYKKDGDRKIKYLSWRGKGTEIDFCYLYEIIGDIYLKIGTQTAIDYWQAFKKSTHYEDDSEFKNKVDYKLSEALFKHLKGYIYKPQTKENQEKFMQIAISKGWR